MQLTQHYLLGPDALLFLLSLAVGSCLACGLGLLAVRRCRHRPAPVRHGLLVGVLLLLCFCPLLLGIGQAFGWGGIPVPRPPGPVGRGPGTLSDHPGHTLPSWAAEAPGDGEPVEDETASAPGAGGGLSWEVFRTAGTLLACIWGVGSSVVVAYFVQGLWTLGRLRKTLKPVQDPNLEQAATRAFQVLGVGPRVRVYQTSRALPPFSLGLIRPRIVLPADLLARLDEEEMRCVLLHEAAHIRRRDHWVALVQFCCAALFWWNPLVRRVNALLARLREEICDDHVVSAGGNRRRFAEALVRVAEWSCSPAAAPLGVSLLDEDCESLEERVRRLLSNKRPGALRMSRLARGAVAAFGLGVSGLLVLSGLRAAEPPARPGAAVSAPAAGVRAAEAPGPVGAADAPAGARDPAGERLRPAPDEPGPPDLGREWLMHLPAGFEHRVTLTPVRPNRYRLEPSELCFSGVYEVQVGRLVIVEPDDPRLFGFEWEIRRDGRLVLVGQPPRAKIGPNYLGATMVRESK